MVASTRQRQTEPRLVGLAFILKMAAAVLVVACAFVLNFCHRKDLVVADATQSQIFTVRTYSFLNPSDVTVHVSGAIDGTAEIHLTPATKIRISGTFEGSTHGDHFERECEVRYEPLDVKSGKVKIRVEMR